MTIKNYYSGSWVDISDYISGLSEMPWTERNTDFTLVLDRWNIGIAGSLRDVRGATYNFSQGDKIMVYDGVTPIYYGLIQKSLYNYATMEFEVEILSALSLLKEKKVIYGELHSLLSGGSPSWYEYIVDVYTHPIVGIVYAMKKMFEACGLTLDLTDPYSTVAFNDGSRDVYYSEFLLSEDMMYCLNQTIAEGSNAGSGIVPDADQGAVPSMFDFVSELCSFLGLGVELTDEAEYALIVETGNYTIADENKLEYKKELIGAEEVAAFLQASMYYVGSGGQPTVSSYRSASPTDVVLQSYDSSGKEIDYWKNLFIFWTDSSDIDTNSYTKNLAEPLVSVSHPANGWNPLKNRASQYLSDINSEEIFADMQGTFKTINAHFIDVEWEMSRIKQESIV